tara:strand:+ start:943 stop:1470 length:528 start_codon:yes stop_codon:yes gene_type:complete
VPLFIIIGFCLWLWAELAALVAIGGELGVLLTIAGIFVTAMVGIWLLRKQGRVIMSSLQVQLARREAPVTSLAAGTSIMVGAVLMLIPGYLTDAIGLAMFLPVVRTLIGASLLKWLTSHGTFMMRGGVPFGADGSDFYWTNDSPARGNSCRAAEDDVIEGDFEERHPDSKKPDRH